VRKLVDIYFRCLKVAAALCLALMVALVFTNVVLRYAFNTGIIVSEELSRWLFVYMTFLGSIVALREGRHLGVDSVVKRLPPRARKVVALVGVAAMLYATWLLLKGSWVQAEINFGNAAPASGLPVGIVYSAGVVFSVSAGLVLVGSAYRLLSGRAAVEGSGGGTTEY